MFLKYLNLNLKLGKIQLPMYRHIRHRRAFPNFSGSVTLCFNDFHALYQSLVFQIAHFCGRGVVRFSSALLGKLVD